METAPAAELYRVIFANIQQALAIVRLAPERDGSPEVIELNRAARELSRQLSDGLPGTVSHVFPGLFEKSLPRVCREAVITGRAAELGATSLGLGHYQVSLFPLHGSYLCLLLGDRATLKKLEQASVSLRKLSAMLLSTLDLEEILDDLIEETVCMLDAESGIAALCTGEGISCYRSFLKGETLPPRPYLSGGAIPGRVIVQTGPYLSNDVAGDPLLDRESAARHGVKSAVSTPILGACGRTIGFLEIHNKKGDSGFNPFDLDQLCSAARITALAVRNAEAFRRVTEMGSRLRESTERYRDLVEGLDAVVWEADAETLQFSFVSPQAERLLGYPVAQWLEPGFWVDHIVAEDRDNALRLCRQATAQGKDHRFVYRARAADGRVVWLRDHARLVPEAEGRGRQLRGLMVDISETKTIENSLRRSEARFRSTFEGAGIGIAMVEAGGMLNRGNPALQSMLGYPERELAGKSLCELTHPEDTANLPEQLAAVVAGELAHCQAESRFIRSDGSEIWGRLTLSAVLSEGAPGYAIAMVEDITERKRAEARNAELLERVQQDAADLERRVAERTAQLQEINEELDSFAHSVSHDLKAPLRTMRGYAEILLEEQRLGIGERQEYLKRIVASAQGMERLINDLFDYSRLSREELVPQPVSLERVVRDAARQLELTSGGREYRLEIAENLPVVLGHHAVLVQVLLNLMSNGIKFVPKGVTPRLRIRGERRGGLGRLVVEDNGIGIPLEQQERIFKIFERLHDAESYPGTGVGLAIVRKAITRLGGSIGLQSREGEGSRFWIELPMSQEGSDAVTPEAARHRG